MLSLIKIYKLTDRIRHQNIYEQQNNLITIPRVILIKGFFGMASYFLVFSGA
jgi:hypothetical protein